MMFMLGPYVRAGVCRQQHCQKSALNHTLQVLTGRRYDRVYIFIRFYRPVVELSQSWVTTASVSSAS